MRSQRFRMVYTRKNYHDIFKCLRDEICREYKRTVSNVEIITEKDGHYVSHCTTEDDDYWDLDDVRDDEYDREYS